MNEISEVEVVKDLLTTVEFREALESLPEQLEGRMKAYLCQGIAPFVEQAEAWAEINRFEEGQRDHAFYLLSIKDKSTSEYKYSFRDVFQFISEEES